MLLIPLAILLLGAVRGDVVVPNCSEIEGAHNVSGACKCTDPDKVINSVWTSCVPIAFSGYGSSCNDTAQCTARMEGGSACVDGSCVCVDNFHYLHGRCWGNRDFGESCTHKESCYQYGDSDAMQCFNDKCECGNYSYSVHENMCRRRAEVDEPCDFELDCPNGTVCSTLTYTCVNASLSAFKVGNDFTEDGYQPDDIHIKACNCSGPYQECTDGGKCVCNRGYFEPWTNGTCLPELGENCNAGSKVSHISHSICRRSGSTGGYVLGCEGGWAPQSSNRACIKSRKYGFNCVNDAMCYYYGGVCVNKKCRCPEGYQHTGQVCWPYVGLGEKCKVFDDCYVHSIEGVDCIQNTCQCIEGYHSTSTKDCWKIPQVLGDLCEDVNECSFISDKDSISCLDNKCTCADGYLQVDDKTCAVGPGGPCKEDTDCEAVPDFKCLHGNCTCPEGTVQSDTNCLEVATNYGDNCTDTIQCTPLMGSNSWCDQEGHCSCNPGYHNREKKCWVTKYLGQECAHASECWTTNGGPQNVECRGSFCHCKYGSKEDVGRNECMPSSSSITYPLFSTLVWYLLAHLVR